MISFNEFSNYHLFLAVITALIDVYLNDKNDAVQFTITESIRKISIQYPAIVIQAAVYFWELHRKVRGNYSLIPYSGKKKR